MGFFDKFKKKAAMPMAAEEVKNQNLFNDITQPVAILMYKAGITSQPSLSFFHNDQGILEGMFLQHTKNPEILQIKQMSEDLYLQVAGMHAFGAGVYVTGLQARFKHPISEYTKSELQSILVAFQETDAYELALNMLGIPAESHNKQVLDQIILTAMQAAKASVGKKIMETQNLKTYMQVLYNAGISMLTLRKIS